MEVCGAVIDTDELDLMGLHSEHVRLEARALSMLSVETQASCMSDVGAGALSMLSVEA